MKTGCLSWLEIQTYLSGTIDEKQLFYKVSVVAKTLGFDYCALGLRAPLPRSKPSIVIFDSYPLGWMEYYARKNFISIDPLLPAALQTVQSIVWSDELFKNSSLFWNEAQQAGLRFGVSQPCRGAHNTLSLLSLVRPTAPLTITELSSISERLLALATLAHERLEKLICAKMIPDAEVRLTVREMEVLRWSSDGCSAAEVANTLSISERTVNFHISNLLSKFSARNKMHVVAKASALGIL